MLQNVSDHKGSIIVIDALYKHEDLWQIVSFNPYPANVENRVSS